MEEMELCKTPLMLTYFSQAFPASGLWHVSLTQWAELAHYKQEQRGIKLPQRNKKFNFKKLTN